MPVLEPMWAAIAAVGVIVALLLIWKFVKFAFKIALIVGVAILVYLGLQQLGVI